MRLRLLVCTVLAAACGKARAPASDASVPDAAPRECDDGDARCSASVLQQCVGGSWQTQEVCPYCDPTQVQCRECKPGENHCFDDAIYTCESDGSRGSVVEACSDGAHCYLGECVDLCDTAAQTHSYIGCEYWAVDLDNAIEVFEPEMGAFGCLTRPDTVERNDLEVCHRSSGPTKIAGLCDENGSCPNGFTCELATVCVLDAQGSPFAVVISNPQAFAVAVTIDDQTGTSAGVTLQPGAVEAFYVADLGFADHSVDYSGISASAYRIVSEAPIVAYQFNPLDNVAVFSNDGSLLIPSSVWGLEYYGLSWPTVTRRPSTNDYNSYLAVVASVDGTDVTVTASAGVRGNGSFGALAAGETAVYTLNSFEVLNLEAVADGDLTGTSVSASAPVAVFGGHEAVRIANTDTSCCADHIEEQLFPASTWGRYYAIARSQSRGMNEADVLRIVAQRDQTSVSITPGQSATCPILATGEYCDVDIVEDVEVEATEPVMVGHYLKSVIESSTQMGNGDPSMALAAPIEQFRESYTFLVPEQYDEQFVSIVGHAGQVVLLDGSDISGDFAPFATGSYVSGRFPVQPGAHTLSCTQGCGLEVYGYSGSVSYLFAGGLDLEPIVID
jgi:hypothetical protein